MSYEITGKLHKVFDTEARGEKGFKTRDIVILTDEKYPQHIKLQLTQDRCDLIEPYRPGDEITAFFNLQGNEWNEKYYTNLVAWRIKGGDTRDVPQPTAHQSSAEEDDLPF